MNITIEYNESTHLIVSSSHQTPVQLNGYNSMPETDAPIIQTLMII